MTLRAVPFDCDGVLVDSERPMLELLHQDMRAFGLDVSFAQVVNMNMGGALPQFAPRLREMGADLPDNWVEDFYDRLYSMLADGTPLISGVDEAVKAVQDAGLAIAIGSNGRLEKMDITLGQHPELRARFGNHVYSGQSLGALKPAPDLYLHMAAVLNASPQECVVIEDSPTGAKAARAAGMKCLGYAAHSNSAALKNEGAQVFSDMSQLPNLLGLA